MYLAGYAVECLLKAKLMRIFDCRHLRELEQELRRRGRLGAERTVFSHELEDLLSLTGGMDRLRHDQSRWRMFNMVNRWIPAWRYAPNRSDRDDADDFLRAVDVVRNWIENNV